MLLAARAGHTSVLKILIEKKGDVGAIGQVILTTLQTGWLGIFSVLFVSLLENIVLLTKTTSSIIMTLQHFLFRQISHPSTWLQQGAIMTLQKFS
jgi:hypothetical protein